MWDAEARRGLVQLVERRVAHEMAPLAAAPPPPGSSTSTAIAPQSVGRVVDRQGKTPAVPDDTELRVAWAAAVGTSPDAEAAFDDVVGRHRQAHRRYHTVRHVTWVVRHVQELATEEPVDDLDAVVVAAFFHDAVYDAAATDNEAQSAALARRVLLDLGWPQAPGQWPSSCGRPQTTPSDDAAVNVLVDADLAVLGSDPAAYQAYVTGVRTEYRHVEMRRGESVGARCCGACSIGCRCMRRRRAGARGGAGPALRGGRAGVAVMKKNLLTDPGDSGPPPKIDDRAARPGDGPRRGPRRGR